MAKNVITVKGGNELKAALKALKGVARGQVLITAAKAGILPIQNAAIANAPYLSGTLRRSIHTEEVAQRSTYAMAATGTDVAYAARLEFGFNATDSLGRTYHQSAQPYMRPAYDTQRGAAIDETNEVLKQLILGSVGR